MVEGTATRSNSILLAIATAFAGLYSGRSDGYLLLGQWSMEDGGVRLQWGANTKCSSGTGNGPCLDQEKSRSEWYIKVTRSMTG